MTINGYEKAKVGYEIPINRHFYVVALRERLERARRERDRQSLSQDLQAIGKRCAAHGRHDTTDHAELLYDEAGLPR
ncbi:type II toxin-antitoxin system VapB family antitoxin [Thiohalocapsa halophila]